MRNAGLDEAQAGVKIAGRNINNLRYAGDWKWRGTKEPLDESERGEWKTGLKLSIQKTKIVATIPKTSRQIDGETMETVRDFTLLGSKITADDEYTREIKRHLLFGRKDMTNLDSVLKSRNITLPSKFCIVKAMFFQLSRTGVNVGL